MERAAKVWVRALDYHGKPFELVAEGDLLAIALQHEFDHLQGTMFVDHLSSLKRELIRRRMKKLKDERAEPRGRRGPPRAAPRVGAVDDRRDSGSRCPAGRLAGPDNQLTP